MLFGKWSGSEIKLDGEDLMIMKESDILGVIEQSVAKKKTAQPIGDGPWLSKT